MDKFTLQTTIRRIKKGDKEAFRMLFEEYQQNLFNYLYFRSKDSDLSEDLLQETFLILWENRKKLDENQSVKSYLYTTASHLFLNHIRHVKIVEQHKNETPEQLFIETQDAQYSMEEKEFLKKLTTAIDQLPDRTKEVFLMSRVESLSNREIADRLEISIKTVETHIGKALSLLSRRIPRGYFKKYK